MRAALVERANIHCSTITRCIFARHKLLAIRVHQHDEGTRILHIGWVALSNREPGVSVDQRLQGADTNLAAEAALKVWPEEAEGASGHFEQPESEACTDRGSQKAATRNPLHLFVAQRLDRLRGEGLRLVARLNAVMAHCAPPITS